MHSEPSIVQHRNPTIARQGFRQMEGFLDVLKTLASTFEFHISSVSVRVQTPRLTLGSLPDEILLEILKYEGMGLSKEDMNFKHRELGLKSLLRYSHICSRFRDFIFSLHSLWALVPLGLDIPLHIIEMIARGSGTLGLTVMVDARWKEPYDSGAGSESSDSTVSDECKTLRSVHVRRVLDEIFRHCSRWDDVHFAVDGRESGQYIQDHPISSVLVSNSIRSLKIFGCGGRNGTHFCHNWTMPHLEKLDWSDADILPLPRCPSSSLPRLSSCSFGFARPKLVEIVAFLCATPTLTSLKLDLGSEPESDEPIGHEVAKLPSLEHLKFRTGNFSADAIAQFLAAIQCPGLKHLSFSTRWHKAYLDLARHMQNRYPILSSFRVNTDWQNEKGAPAAAFFEDILCALPSTVEKIELTGGRKLELCSPSRRNAVAPPLSYPRLKELDLRGCYMLLEDGLYIKLSNVLRRYGVILDHFQPFGYRGRPWEGMSEDERTNVLSILRSAGVMTTRA